MPRKVIRYPTPEEINSLPFHMREYIHDLASVEIQYTIRQWRMVELQNLQLIAKIAELKEELAQMKKARLG